MGTPIWRAHGRKPLLKASGRRSRPLLAARSDFEQCYADGNESGARKKQREDIDSGEGQNGCRRPRGAARGRGGPMARRGRGGGRGGRCRAHDISDDHLAVAGVDRAVVAGVGDREVGARDPERGPAAAAARGATVVGEIERTASALSASEEPAATAAATGSATAPALP